MTAVFWEEVLSLMADYHEEILDCCKKLRLSSGLADRSAVTEGESHQEYLYHLLKSEIDYRQNVRISKLINSAGFPRIYDFGQFRADEVEFQGTQLDELKTLEFYRQHKNIIMYGCTGTGKTMLSICIGIAVCRKGIPVTFFRTAPL